MKFSAIVDGKKRVYARTEKKGNRLTVRFPLEELSEGKKEIVLFKDELTAMAGEDGWIFDSFDHERYSSALTYFKKDRDDFVQERKTKLINAFGGKIGGICFLGVVTGMPYEYVHVWGKEGDKYYLGIKYDLEESELYEDIEVEMFLHSENATYIDLAKTYRSYLLCEGGCTPLKDRAEGNEVLAYLRDSVEIRMRLGWKPAPCTVAVQTLENEPEMHVACTFERVRDFADELKKAGVEKAELCLVGWNKSGHDGRWPEAFPVEEKLGGEEELKKTVEYVKSLGYKIVCHSNSTDYYQISGRDMDGVCIRERDGSIKIESSKWSGGVMRSVCPISSLKITREHMPKIKALGFDGAHYIDVFSIAAPRKCFDKKHFATVRDYIELWKLGAKCVREHFGAFQSEGAFDHTASMIDFGLYAKWNRNKPVSADEGIPFFEIATHGIIMANQGTNTVNLPRKRREDFLQQIEFGGKPAFYVHSKFKTDKSHWMGSVDYITDTDADLVEAANDVRAIEQVYAPLAHLQNEFIENYEVLTPEVRKTTYSNGEYTVVNYSEQPYTLENGTTVEPMGYVLCH